MGIIDERLAARAYRAEDGQGIGATLRQRREALGLDLARVSAATRLTLRRLEALEAEDFALFRAHVFAAGALRSYARLLGLSEAPLIAALDAETRAPRPGEEQVLAPRRLRRPGCFWGSRGHISLFG